MVSLVLCVAFSLLALIRTHILSEAGGSVKIKWDGIYTVSHEFQDGTQKVYVLSLLHYADRSFYDKMIQKIPLDSSLILLEGIRDEKRLMGTSIPYPEEKYGMTSQFGTFTNWIESRYNFAQSDIDVSELESDLQNYTIHNFKEGSILDKILASPEDRILADKLEKKSFDLRNEHLIQVFDSLRNQKKTIVFTWGAIHTPFILKSLKERGYSETSTFEEKAIAFW